MADVERGVAPVGVDVVLDHRQRVARFRSVVHRVRQRVVQAPRHAVPRALDQRHLQRVVLRAADRLELVDRREVRIQRVERTARLGQRGARRRGVDVAHQREAMAARADVADLRDRGRPELLLDVDVEVDDVRQLQILADRERAVRRLRRRPEDGDVVDHRLPALRDREHRLIAAGVVADAERAAVGEPGVRGEEGHREHVVEQAVAGADHRLAAVGRHPGDAEARRDRVLLRRIERVGRHHALGRQEVGQLAVARAEHARAACSAAPKLSVSFGVADQTSWKNRSAEFCT